ncbi:hypothetical protein NDU88_005208 [Pleurodeles waltl]|uniref:Uncharacterized protein n=1 Tax=Pleurodeles waltl TaxID=8319 RepID=A0AAV7SL12_PLEWA|nr:hypothetical protein NDU88_005208 [Pleurodeles waltl]
MDPKVQEALDLLRQAGRLDVVNFGALAPARPACRASAGVAAAVAACSPPRHVEGAQVRGGKGKALREAGRGVTRAGRGRAIQPGIARGSPRASLGEGRVGGLRAGWRRARRGPGLKGYGPQRGEKPITGAGGSGALPFGSSVGPMGSVKPAKAGSRVKKGGPDQHNIGGVRAGAFEEDRLPPLSGDKDKTDSPGSEEQRDPRVPVSKKWPTINSRYEQQAFVALMQARAAENQVCAFTVLPVEQWAWNRREKEDLAHLQVTETAFVMQRKRLSALSEQDSALPVPRRISQTTSYQDADCRDHRLGREVCQCGSSPDIQISPVDSSIDTSEVILLHSVSECAFFLH